MRALDATTSSRLRSPAAGGREPTGRRSVPAPGSGSATAPALTAALALLAVLLAAPVPTAAQQPEAGQEDRGSGAILEKVATVEGITEYRLSNGLQVLLFPDPSKSTTTVNVTYHVGSRHEGYGEAGMAHLLEHMLFKGTPDHPNIYDEITAHGGSANGTTWFDRTNYYETFPASEENLAWALDMEADRMVNSTISEEDLESEVTVVRNEFEISGNNPGSILFRRTQAAAFRWHNYGQPTIGSRSDIENVPVERLHAFYRKYYQPDNATLIIAGKFDRDRALELVAKEFGAVPKPDRTGEMKIYPTYTDEPSQEGPKEVTVRRVGDHQQLTALYHVPPGSHEDFTAVDLLTHVLASEPSGRLYRALVEGGKASDVSATAYSLKEPGLLRVDVEVRTEDSLEDAEETLLAVMDSLRSRPPTEEEVGRAKNAQLRDMRLLFNDSQQMAVNLSDWTTTGDWRLFFVHRQRIEDATVQDLADAVRTYVVPSNRTLGRFVPTEEEPDLAEIPAAPDVTKLVADLDTGGEETASGAAFEPTPANIEDRVQRGELGNGFEYALLPKASRGNSVTARFTLRFGNLDDLRGERTAGSLAAAMLMRGTEQLGRQQIQDRLSELQAELNLSGGATSLTGTIETTRENFPEVLDLLKQVLHEPAFAEEEFRTLVDERLSSLEQQRSRPLPRAFRAFQGAVADYPEGHPSRTLSVEEEIRAIEGTALEDVRSFYRRFYGAQAGTMAVVGDFDSGRVGARIEEIFGGWTSERPYERIATPAQDLEPRQVEVRVPDKPNAVYVAGTTFRLRDDHPDHPALTLANVMLGAGFLNARLQERLRQKMGISYAVQSLFNASGLEEDATFLTLVMFAPQNREEVKEAVRDELQKALDEGFTEEEVERAKEGWLNQQQTQRSDDGNLAALLNSQLHEDRTMEWQARLEDEIAGLTPDRIREALRKHLDPAALTTAEAGDFAGSDRDGSEE